MFWLDLTPTSGVQALLSGVPAEIDYGRNATNFEKYEPILDAINSNVQSPPQFLA